MEQLQRKTPQEYSPQEQETITIFEENERKNNSLVNRVGRKLGISATQRAFDRRSGENTMLVDLLPEDYLTNTPDQEPRQ